MLFLSRKVEYSSGVKKLFKVFYISDTSHIHAVQIKKGLNMGK